MPPKAKFTREQIIDAAVKITETDGFDCLTARSLGKSLGVSARPMFTAFENMREIADAVKKRADEIYTEYVHEGLKEPKPFKGVGMAYIRFAAERPKLFRLLFMSEQSPISDTQSILHGIESSYDLILSSICESYDLPVAAAEKLYLHNWIYSHGIAVLIATQKCAFETDEVSQMLTDVFTGLLIRAKKGELQ